MPEENLRQKTISGALWRLAERIGAQSVSFAVSLIIARIIEPTAYGVIALTTVFTSILDVFVDSGLGNAIIQKKDADNLDFSTVFYTNIVLGIFLYSLIYFSSPFISNFYDMPILTSILRILGLNIIISSVKNIQLAYVTKNLLFKKFFKATLAGTICAAIVGITLAYKGFGVWSLILQNVTNNLVDTIILWFCVAWKPSLIFSNKRLNTLFSFGSKLLLAKLIDTIFEDIRTLVIGKLYSTSDLAFYNRGKQFPTVIFTNINTTVDSVLFPTMVKKQESPESLKRITQRSIKFLAYCLMPMMSGLAVCGKSIVLLILTEKWLPCLPYMYIFCISTILAPIQIANTNVIKAMGKGNLVLKLEIIKKIINTISLLLAINHGAIGIAYSLLANSIINLYICAKPNGKIINYGYYSQIKDIIPPFILSSIMAVVVYQISFLNMNLQLILLTQIFIGFITYIILSQATNNETYIDIKNLIKPFIKNIFNSNIKEGKL